jgi:hypothetical protein
MLPNLAALVHRQHRYRRFFSVSAVGLYTVLLAPLSMRDPDRLDLVAGKPAICSVGHRRSSQKEDGIPPVGVNVMLGKASDGGDPSVTPSASI